MWREMLFQKVRKKINLENKKSNKEEGGKGKEKRKGKGK